MILCISRLIIREGRWNTEYRHIANASTLAAIKMMQLNSFRNELEAKNDLEWFDVMCDILTKVNQPTTNQLTDIIGFDKPNPKGEVRGSRFLVPYDRRFTWACINPSLIEEATDKPIEYLAFGGELFALKMADITKRFQVYRTQSNIYDGGTQIFFYPVPNEYEFTALDFWIREESEEIDNINELIFHSVTFKFGDKLFLARDGYYMKR